MSGAEVFARRFIPTATDEPAIDHCVAAIVTGRLDCADCGVANPTNPTFVRIEGALFIAALCDSCAGADE